MPARAKLLLTLFVLVSGAAIVLSPFVKSGFQSWLAEAVGLPQLVGVFPIGDRFGMQLAASSSWGGVASEIASLAFRFIVGLLFLFTTPGLLRSAREQTVAGGRAWRRVLGIGLLAWFAMLLVMVLGWGGGVTPVRVAQTVIVFFGMMVCIRIGGAMLAFETGRVLARWMGIESPLLFVQLGLGLLTLFALTALPAVGVVAATVINAHAIGLFVATVFDVRRLHGLNE